MTRIALPLVALVSLAACRDRSPVLSPGECTNLCTQAAGSDGAFCPKVCGATCEQRCTDLMVRVGGGLPRCTEMCATSCADLEHTYGISHELCGWIVENRPTPAFTPRELAAH